MIYVALSLSFPADETDTRFFTIWLEHGAQPRNGNVPPDVKPLKPGETVTISVKPDVVDSLRRSLREQGSGRALKMNRAQLYARQVYFDANTLWILGTISVRDPVTGEWKDVKPISYIARRHRRQRRVLPSIVCSRPDTDSAAFSGFGAMLYD